MSESPPDATFGCPQCGHGVAYGTPTCGNCGNDLRPYFQASVSTSTRSSGPRVLGLLVLLLAVGGALFLVSDPRNEFDFFPNETIQLPAQVEARPGGPRPRVVYGNVRAFVRELRADGLPCRDVRVDDVSSAVATGSCQSRGTHVQINIYLDDASLRAARHIFKDWPFDTVHAANWWVITSRPVAREVARISGGRFQKAT